ncbi:MAG: hypothetical protein RL264_2221 [Bacteroidota bacterium]|jgi:hypothetical protein
MEKLENQRIWIVLLILAFLGIGFITLISFQVDTEANNGKVYLIAVGTGLLIAGASFSSGALSGFLFGIPRIINSSASKSNELTQNVILHNDNLVQISDWLTKIIVGVGLTQINSLPEKLHKLGEVISPCFKISSDNNPSNDLGITIAISILLYFLFLGFMASYLWTRIYFGKLIRQETTIVTNKLSNETSQAI